MRPERVRKIKLDIIKRQAALKEKKEGSTLADLFGDEVMCANCFI